MVLAGDIGGTKTDMALYELVQGELKLIAAEQFKNSSYSRLNDILEEFEELHSFEFVKSACFALAGLVENGTCKITNLDWSITEKEIQEYLNIRDVKLINDLQATAYGMLHLSEDEFVHLNPDAKKISANRAVIAAGTGLGEAILYFDGKDYRAIATEGGHTDFAPINEQQERLLKYLRRRYETHVSYERVLSGDAITQIYEFLSQENFAKEPIEIVNINPYQDKNALISHLAIEKNDPLCSETLRLFCEIYAAEAGNLALKCNARGGIYIGGGIAVKILPFLLKKEFMQTLTCKGRFKYMLEALEVKVSLNAKTALLGAGIYASKSTG